MKSVLRFFLMLALASCAVAQTTPAPPEELALRRAYATPAAKIGKVVLNKALAKGPIPEGFNLNAAGVPIFVISNITIGNVSALPNNLNQFVTAKTANSNFLSLGADGLPNWQAASQSDPPLFLGGIQTQLGVTYTEYVHYSVGATLWGTTRNYQALAIIGRDLQGKRTLKVFDRITPFVGAYCDPNTQECNGGGGDGSGGENTPETRDTDIGDGGDGGSIDLSYQVALDDQDMDIGTVPDQWIDPVLADPLFANPNLGSSSCQECIQTEEDRCAADRKTTVLAACITAFVVVASCIVVDTATLGLATAACFTPSLGLGTACLSAYYATNFSYNACMATTKNRCASQCK